ncbi:protein kinase [Streptomyces sp. O3]
MQVELPGPEFWALIRPYTGELVNSRPAEHGFGSDLTAVVDCERGPFFVKAMRNHPGGRRNSIIREREVNPYVQPISPALRWSTENEEWIVLGFAVVDGRKADFTPGSPDLPAVIDTLIRIGALELPKVAEDWPENRWDRFAADESEASQFRGSSLLYTDINESNIIIGGHDAWAVDWSWPTKGAGFIDPACLVVQLIAAGHNPESAESWAAQCPAWGSASTEALDAFASATLRMNRAVSARKPTEVWLESMAEAAQAWASHRGVAVSDGG